jgi:inosine-uridine nucleoside N-ribohydrolase
MGQKTVIVADPGIDGAFALALALHDPDLEVLGVIATAGNVGAEQATRNVQVVVEQLDPPRWPRLGAALAGECEVTAPPLYGPDGLGGANFPCAQLHHPAAADKLLSELVRLHPREVAVLLLGPATALARALDRDAELIHLVERVVMVGGTAQEPGDAGPVSEFHLACDPPAARQVLRCGAPLTLVPLDVTRKLVFSPGDVRNLLAAEGRLGTFLGRVVPHGLAPTAGQYGIEGVYLNDVVGLVALARPGMISTKPTAADVETRGELTRGMSVFDRRWNAPVKPNVDLAVEVDIPGVRGYMQRVLAGAT